MALVRHEADRAAGAHPRVPEPDQRGWIDPHLLRVSRRTRSRSARSRSQSPRRRTPSPGPLRSNSRRSRSTARQPGGAQRKSRSVTAAGPPACSRGQVEMCQGEQRQRGFAPASPCCAKRSRSRRPYTRPLRTSGGSACQTALAPPLRRMRSLRARTCDARDVQRGDRHRDSLAHCTMWRGTPPSSRTRIWRSLGDVAAIGVDWVPRAIWVPNWSAKVRK
jgi:hypothetical protein